MTTLSVSNLSVRRGAVALENLSVELQIGESLALIGPNGGGKSTLLACLANLLCYGGSVKWGSLELSQLKRPELARVVGYLPQRVGELPSFRTDEFLHLNRFVHGRWGGSRSRRDYEAVERAMEMARVKELGENRINSLSGGELQRVLLAGVLAQETPVILLDEPTTSLDPLQEAHFFAILQDLLSLGDRCIMLASHKVSRCLGACSKVLGLRAGRVMYSGPPSGARSEGVMNDIFGFEEFSGDLRLGGVLVPSGGDAL